MDQVDMSNLERPIKLPVPHIHTMTEKCNAGPDRIFGQTGKTYYACIGGQEVCNLSGGDHGVRIPQSMTDEFDAHMVEFRQRQNALRQELVATGRSTGDAGRDQQIAAQRLEFTAAALKRDQASGVRPNLLEIRRAAEAAYPMAPGVALTSGGPSAQALGQNPSVTLPVSLVAPAQPPIDDQRILAIAKGTPIATVVQELGSPHGRISGGMERFTYRLTSGRAAKLDFDNGVVSEVRITPN